MSLVVENRVRMMGADEWANQSVLRAARAYAAGIVQQLQRELTLGARRH